MWVDVNFKERQWSSSATSALAYAIALLLNGWLSPRFGQVRLLVVSVLAETVNRLLDQQASMVAANDMFHAPALVHMTLLTRPAKPDAASANNCGGHALRPNQPE